MSEERRTANGGGRRPRTASGKNGAPRRDLGPAASVAPTYDRAHPFNAWATTDAFTVEAIEMASVRAEEAVSPFLANRRERPFTGVSSVEIRFLDDCTLSSFRRVRALRGVTAEGSWRLVRRWADAHGDGGLDEAMCGAVATTLNRDFGGLLTASVVTWVIRTP
ncbi:hypothetical protein [Sphingomonas pseudosanguinis]|uniref:Uncharacterized protein n=1 Tax=Sphingomonas pseudosanguinis TaxID=413712 RepID=A0A7W6A880_9SPHN|nr:hypothetical protein [Sphingomonas pseudosanguinis]MBB3877764.1 hypothetical protein [Sphingomonas pseudosanguinis]MBN3537642.1 hypothetical protein [Sphingomonas pseudosanguinis]